MFKLFLKYNIFDYCINNFFDKVIQNFNFKNPYKSALTIFDLGPEHNGSELKRIRFRFKGDMVDAMVDASIDQPHVDKIYLFQAWIPSSKRSDWQIHVINTDGNLFHYPINEEALLYLL